MLVKVHAVSREVLSLHKNINIKEINVINPVQSLNSCVPILFCIKDRVVESRFAVTVRDAKDNIVSKSQESSS